MRASERTNSDAPVRTDKVARWGDQFGSVASSSRGVSGERDG